MSNGRISTSCGTTFYRELRIISEQSALNELLTISLPNVQDIQDVLMCIDVEYDFTRCIENGKDAIYG